MPLPLICVGNKQLGELECPTELPSQPYVPFVSSFGGCLAWEVAQSCPTLCNPMDCSLPGSSVHRIFQARVLEWVAIGGWGGGWEMTCSKKNKQTIFELFYVHWMFSFLSSKKKRLLVLIIVVARVI
ncbi:unnamed protein product [Rangifer tarandus platyrhynchus]|uniref:Uncharacterized protein n=2 Tax=Rangifer tarandus platyrhynchus TaxID=3082113 RepID=A0ABN8ZFP9_RANTA|nr:unnamed protein product [Rangifer tarandus platyrhynchus]